ncbi:MAG: signal recognition particle protein Srp19 [Candidatus Hydrothermarchaeota archaeon]|nr:MAG: signal recognition particle protein Srp19 [Candidatus Hydrothermarchaeota archaeon]
MDKLVIWPAYLDKTKSRQDGRKISSKLAVTSPTLSEIEQAAKRLNLNPIAEKDKAYPKEWWEVSGRVLVDKVKPKSLLLKDIAKEIRRMRAEGK